MKAWNNKSVRLGCKCLTRFLRSSASESKTTLQVAWRPIGPICNSACKVAHQASAARATMAQSASLPGVSEGLGLMQPLILWQPFDNAPADVHMHYSTPPCSLLCIFGLTTNNFRLFRNSQLFLSAVITDRLSLQACKHRFAKMDETHC